jgi:GNAT superfamily N-acetyltransferase
MLLRPAKDTEEDKSFILFAHRSIEGEGAGLTEERLLRDIFCDKPRAFINMMEEDGRVIGFILYSETYWASTGPVLWVSQMYVVPERRGRYVFRLKRWIEEKAKEWQAHVIAWGTHRAADRSSRLWEAAGAKDISGGYSFWIKKI